MNRHGNNMNVISFLRRASQLFPEQGVAYGNKQENYEEIYHKVRKISAGMKRMGVRKGDIVGVADWNTLRFFELLYAAASIGFIIYPVNIRLPAEHILYTLRQSGCSWLFASDDFAPLAMKSGIPSERVIILNQDDNLFFNNEEAEDEVSGDEPYSILYTSGTTGMPKGVLYTNEKVVLGAMSIVYQLGLFNASAKLTSEDVIMPLIPFFHLWGWGSPFHAAYLGAKYILGGRFSVESTIDSIVREGVTWINAIPTMMYQLTDSSRAEELKGIKVLIGGSPIPKGLADRMERLGIKYSTIYGGTDMLATAIQLRKTEHADSIHPVPFVEFKVVTAEGKAAGKGENGELYVKAPWLPDGYYKDEERSKTSFSEGWFRTGDFARINEDGGIQVLDRVKDVIKSGGEWIPSSVLESLISEVEGIASVAVIGREDQKWGERPLAIIKLKGERSDAIIDEIKARLQDAASKGKILQWWIPDKFIIADDIPLTSVGKIDKKVLKERYKQI